MDGERNERGAAADPATEQNQTFRQRCLAKAKDNLLLVLLLIGLAIGIGMGTAMRNIKPPLTARQQMYFRFPGDLLMRMLRMLIIPLIVTSLVSGLANLDAKSSGKMGLRAIVYYFSTTFIAVVLGLFLVLTIKPGEETEIGSDGQNVKSVNTADSFLDLIRNMIPDNIVVACFKQTRTVQIRRNNTEHQNASTVNETTASPNSTGSVSPMYDFEVRQEDGMNVLGLVVFSVALGIVTSRLGEVGKPLLGVTLALAEATMKLVTLVIWYSPIGIAFLVASEILKMKDPLADLRALGLFIVTVVAGLSIHGIIILPLLYFITVRKNPITYVLGILQAIMTAFGTASSSATLPVTYRCLEVNNGVDRRVTRFVLPVGATVNMDGTALYEAVAAIFIAQMRGINLNFGQIVAASITATAASIGAASVPQAGLVTLIIVLTSLGLPTSDVSRIMAVDWLLDRFRTAVNVEGDSIGAGIIAHLSRKELREPEPDLNVQVPQEGASAVAIESSMAGPQLANGMVNKAFTSDREETRF